MRQTLKVHLNKALLLVTGHTITKPDQSNYSYREDLYKTILDEYGGIIEGPILDTGSNYGSWAKDRFGKAYSVTTFDQQENADVRGDLLSLPFPDDSFGTVFCFETLEHVKNPFRAVAELYRVLQPGGIFIGSAPFTYEIHGEEYGDYWRFTKQGWTELLSSFGDVEIRAFGKDARAPHHYLAIGKKVSK